MEITIRKAEREDVGKIDELLSQVLNVHHDGRPDLFKAGCRKYSDDELICILENEDTPIFVAVNGADEVVGYVFCVLIQMNNHNILTDIKTLYIDDLCVDERERGNKIGQRLYEYVKAYAKDIGCYNITLNVWSCNENAIKFYQRCGLSIQKQGMEIIL